MPQSVSQSEGKATVSREEVRQVIRDNLKAIKNCYEVELKNQPELQGKIVLEFEVSDQGVVKASKIRSSTLNNSNVETCTQGIIQAARFPSAPKETVAVIVYPFVFGKTEEAAQSQK
jgi:hypothetical protein